MNKILTIKGQQESGNIVAEFKEVMLLLTAVFAQRATVLIWALFRSTRVDAILLKPPTHPAPQLEGQTLLLSFSS